MPDDEQGRVDKIDEIMKVLGFEYEDNEEVFISNEQAMDALNVLGPTVSLMLAMVSEEQHVAWIKNLRRMYEGRDNFITKVTKQ